MVNLAKMVLIPKVKSTLKITFVAFFVFAGSWGGIEDSACAQIGGITLTPQRIVFEDRQRGSEVVLLNRATTATTYRIFFINFRMNDKGQLVEIKKPSKGDMFADKLIRYSPRQITIPAGGVQKIRLMVRKPRDLPDGEYRSHLAFQAQPKDIGQDIEAVAKKGKLKVQLVAILSLSIPIIIRHGNLSSSVEISDLALDPPKKDQNDKRNLSFKLHRHGNRSIHGDFNVTYKPQKGEDLEIGILRGAAVYTSTKIRDVKIPLNLPEEVVLSNGTLHVVYRDSKKEDEILAEAELTVP